jgi:hypothetical protein
LALRKKAQYVVVSIEALYSIPWMFQYRTKHLLSKTWCVYIATLSHSENQDRKNKRALFPIDKPTH